MSWDVGLGVIALTAGGAAVVTGALGYGFSSLTVPVALLFRTGRVLNPALVLIEVVLNLWALVVNRRALAAVVPRTWPLVVGLLPGVALGSCVLSTVHPGWMRLLTFMIVLPLLFLQAAGIRRPIRQERAWGLPLGMTVGALYSITTISGPPLALLFNNQGMVQQEFRAALALVRSVESLATAAAYLMLGMFTWESAPVLGAVAPAVLVGLPVGAWLIARVDSETFRRVAMSFDIWVVSFGLSHALRTLELLPNWLAWNVMLAPILLDVAALATFFTSRRATVGAHQG